LNKIHGKLDDGWKAHRLDNEANFFLFDLLSIANYLSPEGRMGIWAFLKAAGYIKEHWIHPGTEEPHLRTDYASLKKLEKLQRKG